MTLSNDKKKNKENKKKSNKASNKQIKKEFDNKKYVPIIIRPTLMKEPVLNYSFKQFVIINLACGIPYNFSFSELGELTDPNIFERIDEYILNA